MRRTVSQTLVIHIHSFLYSASSSCWALLGTKSHGSKAICPTAYIYEMLDQILNPDLFGSKGPIKETGNDKFEMVCSSDLLRQDVDHFY